MDFESIKEYFSSMTTNDMILLGLVVAFVIVLITLIVVVIKNSKRKVYKKLDEATREIKLDELKNMGSTPKPEPVVAPKVNKPEPVKAPEPIKPEPVIEPKVVEPQEEEVEVPKVDLEAITKTMAQDISPEPAKDYEDEQEDTAVISYEELLKATQKQEEKKEETKEFSTSSFKNSEVISPIYGKGAPIQEIKKEENLKNPLDFKQKKEEPVQAPKEEEIEEISLGDDEFLDDLKNLRNNL